MSVPKAMRTPERTASARLRLGSRSYWSSLAAVPGASSSGLPGGNLVVEIEHGECRHQVGAVLLHQREGLRGGEGAVLDRVDARAYRVLDGRCGVDVRRLSCRARAPPATTADSSSLVISCCRGSSPVEAMPPEGITLMSVGAAPPVLAHAEARLLRRVDDAVVPAGVIECGIEAVARIAVPGGRTERLERHPPAAGLAPCRRQSRFAQRDCLGAPAEVSARW